ncbi:MAG: IMPACT family protein [Rhodothermales bacterium]
MTDVYRTIRGTSVCEIKEKGSRFIAEATDVRSEDAAMAFLADVRQCEHGATHHCWAYRLGPGGDRFRYNDDGEPSGTAGQPILRQIDALELTNALVVVTRYFGGTKLGTGGLLRAYGDAAAEALEAAQIVQRVIRVPLRLIFGYEDTSPAMQVLSRFEAKEIDARYAEETELVIGVRTSEVEAFTAAFTEALGGRGSVANGE